jgi:hypothetical protein
MTRRWFSGFALGCVLLCLPARPWAMPAPKAQTPDEQARPEARFALVIGVNRSIDPELTTLRYAAADAARYFDLFRSLGLKTYLLTRVDKSTRKLHAQAAAEAQLPRKAQLLATIQQMKGDIARAKARGVSTALYVVYAGHGNIKQGVGYISLEDWRLTSTRIRQQILDPVGAHWVHLVVDACHSYFLVRSRGPGGKHRRFTGLDNMKASLMQDHIGLLLSTSAASESHEWGAFQAGVFSHEVRSGLLGPADADGDKQISYREIAAFVHQANRAIANPRYRPRVFARPPKKRAVLLDLRHKNVKTVQIDGARHGRYRVEDVRGVRLADFHSSRRARPVLLVRPAASGTIFLRRLPHAPNSDVSSHQPVEYTIPPAVSFNRPPEGARAAALAPIRLAQLTGRPSAVQTRGAAHQAFRQLFSQPFDHQVVQRFRMPRAADLIDWHSRVIASDALPRWRRIVGYSALGVGGAALAAGIAFSVSAKTLRDRDDGSLSQKEAQSINRKMEQRDIAAISFYAVAGSAVLGGLLSLLLPHRSTVATAAITPTGALLSASVTF